MLIDQQRILVLGGAGYIGSHMVYALQRAGFLPIVLDNLSRRNRFFLKDVKFILGELADVNLLNKIFSTYQISAVMHFASFIEVAESLQFPEKYYQNNIAATLTFLDVMLQHKVKHFIFSSSASVYGEPQYTPIDESHPLNPITPYGRSKKIVEDILKECCEHEALSFAILRYFNAAGADPSGELGENHEPESHLIPRVLKASQQNKTISIFGADYPTKDGTCIRDYIHVNDICAAHLLALQALLRGEKHLIYNIGTGEGHSIFDVLQTAYRVTGKRLKVKTMGKRNGDPGILIADSRHIQKELHWRPQFADLYTIMQHAWQFMEKQEKR